MRAILPVLALVLLLPAVMPLAVDAAEDSGPISPGATGNCNGFSTTPPMRMYPGFDGTLLATDVYVPAGAGPGSPAWMPRWPPCSPDQLTGLPRERGTR